MHTHSWELHDYLRDRWELLMHTRQLFFSKENKNPGAKCIGTVQMGLQGYSLFTRKRNRALIIEWPLFLGIYFPQLVSSRISFQRPKQQLSMTSAPSKGEAGWPLSPCQDVLITWMQRIGASIWEQYFYSLSASHTFFSCLLKETSLHLFLSRLLATFSSSCRLSAPSYAWKMLWFGGLKANYRKRDLEGEEDPLDIYPMPGSCPSFIGTAPSDHHNTP